MMTAQGNTITCDDSIYNPLFKWLNGSQVNLNSDAFDGARTTPKPFDQTVNLNKGSKNKIDDKFLNCLQ